MPVGGDWGREVVSFECKNCGQCCGPIPLRNWELDSIKSALWEISGDDKQRIKQQKRDALTCILWDAENKRCLIYRHRPLVCRQYGQVHEMPCPNNEKPCVLISGEKELHGSQRPGEYLVGILSLNIGWRELEAAR